MADGDTVGYSGVFQFEKLDYACVEREKAALDKLKYGGGSVHLADGGDTESRVPAVGDFP